MGVKDMFAQRSGFVIGFGIGLGVTSYSFSEGVTSYYSNGFTTMVNGPDEEGEKFGLATDFKIGAQVSQSFQIYYLGRTNWFDDGRSGVAAGISVLGVTYVLPSAPVHLSGGIGAANWFPLHEAGGGGIGFGMTGGVGWEFADLWLLDFALTYGRPAYNEGHVDMFLARVGISILSH